MAVGFINDKFKAGSTSTGKQFQVDTNGTLMTNLQFWLPLKGVIIGDETITDEYGGHMMKVSSGHNEGWNSDGPDDFGAVDLDGSNDYLRNQWPHFLAEGFDGSNNNHVDFSISLWFRTDTVAATKGVVSHFDSNSGSKKSWTAVIADNGGTFSAKMQCHGTGSSAGTNGWASDFGALSADTWYHYVGYHDNANDEIGCAVNGTLTKTAHTTGLHASTASFMVGDINENSGSIPFDGEICRIAYWDKVLTQQEITDLYNSGNGNNLI